MTFLAGAISLDRGPLDPDERETFLQTLDRTTPRLPLPPRTLSRPDAILARSGFDRLWQGPALLSSPSLDAAGIGTQWRPSETSPTALETLAEAVDANEIRAAAEAFDGFACAFLPAEGRPPVLLTDPLGLFPVAFTRRGRTLFFSSHQGFLRSLPGQEVRPNLQAALEFLVIGHAVGRKTLLRGVDLLPPGTGLACENGAVRPFSYLRGASDGHPKTPASPVKAADRLLEHLAQKRDRYKELCDDPVLGFLSGGWDSRLLVALFAEAGRIERTLTTQQRVRLGEHYISEEAVAGEVAGLLGVENRFVPPSYRDPSTLHARAARLDHATWFHDWAFRMADEVPLGRYLMLDGLLGDILLRALLVDDDLAAAQEAGDRKAAGRVLHHRLREGFNTYTPGVGTWASVLRREVLDDFSNRLREELEEEMEAIDHEQFVPLFLLRNRSRRGIAPLPRLVFGARGDVHLPFCDPEFVRLALAIPLGWRRDGSLYRLLLERARPGLSRIPSTNDRDPKQMAPYLTRTLPEETVRGVKERREARLEALCQAPPAILEHILSPATIEALARKDKAALSPHLPLLEKVLMLEGFFGERPPGSPFDPEPTSPPDRSGSRQGSAPA